MKFTDLDVSGFGIWSGLEIESLSPQLTVIYGPNEAGKTTILECLRGVLYGFTPSRRDRYLPPVHGGAGRGALGIRFERQHYRIARHDDGSRLLGGVTVTLPDGATQGETQLADLLAGVDESLYSNVFSVGLRELQELATLNDGQAAAWLYDLSTGLDGVSISDVLRELRTSRSRLISPTADKSQVIDLVAQRDALRGEIDELGSLNDRYWRLSAEHEATAEATRAAEALQAALAAEIQTLDAALAVREPWRERTLVEARLTAFGTVGDFPTDALRRLRNFAAGLHKARRRRAQIMRRRQELRVERAGIKVNEPLWRQAARIAALSEHESWIATLDDQLRGVELKVSEHERQLAAARANCGLPDHSTASSEALAGQATAALRGPANQLRAARKQLKEVRDECRSLHATRGASRDEVARALSGRGEASLAAALDKQGQLVSQYRRRLQLDDRLDQMALHRNELEEKHRRLIDQQVLPLWLLISIAAVFVLGGGLVLAGLILPWGVGVAVLGGLIAAGAVAGKFGIERSAANRLDGTEKQLKMLGRQLEQAKAERSELDALLPSGGGALAGRLQNAEAELASLEALLSIDGRRQTADDEAAAAKIRYKTAAEEWSRARRRWQQALAEAGLPVDLSPPQVRQMTAQAGSLQTFERQLAQSRDERDRWRRERAAVAARIDQITVDTGWTAPPPSAAAEPLVEQLRRLRRELAAEEELVERRSEMDRQLERLRRLALKYSRRMRRLARRRRELFRAAGALDESDFRRRAEERAELDELLRRRAALAQQIRAALCEGASEPEVAGLLNLPSDQLERQRDELFARRQSAADDIKRLAEDRGRIVHEQSLLAGDRRLSRKQLELSVVEERLAEAAARWRTLAITEHLIESVKEDYERNRQPEVLQEASQYLERMTEGRYRRVWTPLGENVLRVDDDTDRTLATELLSTGAREQLFLALRLALVSRYARHGKSMPLVLDDVLVNFDMRRARAAAEVFTEYAASGRQILLFTCHEHIADLFRAMRADVRQLPSNADASRKIVGPAPSEHVAGGEPPRRRREKRAKEQPPESEPQATPAAAEAEIATPDLPTATLDGPVEQMTSTAISTGGLDSTADVDSFEWLAVPPAPRQLAPLDEPPPDDAPPPKRAPEPSPPKPTRRHRADLPHRVAPVKAVRRRWSAEEFDGELEDQVNAAFEAAAWGDLSPTSNGRDARSN